MPRSTGRRTQLSVPVHYQVEIADPHAHLYRVKLTVAQPQAQQRLALPVWIPGS